MFAVATASASACVLVQSPIVIPRTRLFVGLGLIGLVYILLFVYFSTSHSTSSIGETQLSVIGDLPKCPVCTSTLETMSSVMDPPDPCPVCSECPPSSPDTVIQYVEKEVVKYIERECPTTPPEKECPKPEPCPTVPTSPIESDTTSSPSSSSVVTSVSAPEGSHATAEVAELFRGPHEDDTVASIWLVSGRGSHGRKGDQYKMCSFTNVCVEQDRLLFTHSNPNEGESWKNEWLSKCWKVAQWLQPPICACFHPTFLPDFLNQQQLDLKPKTMEGLEHTYAIHKVREERRQ